MEVISGLEHSPEFSFFAVLTTSSSILFGKEVELVLSSSCMQDIAANTDGGPE